MKAATRTTGLMLATLLLTSLPRPSAADKQPAETQTAEDATGSELYIMYQCWQCHGYEGQGGAAPRVAPNAYPWDAFVRFVRFPNDMPAYPQEALSDGDLRTIYDYLQSIPEPSVVKNIPALDGL